jgi:radical SAM superfamily enzyme YgiQ (UPF0313 family)
MLDILIITPPGIDSKKHPQLAPAILKSSIEAAGFTCRTMDYNIRLLNDIPNGDNLNNWFMMGLDDELILPARDIIKKWADEIISINPKYLGISVFTYQSRTATNLFCEFIKANSNIKIVLGGQGLSSAGTEGKMQYAEELKAQGKIDHYIRSEGEISMVELLKGNITHPGIDQDTYQQIDDLDALPFPNYDDYDLTQYEMQLLPMLGSRGCVRSCSFCDIHEHWKYRYRSGANVAEEMIYHNKKYKTNYFIFTDSLVNGSLKEFKKFVEIMADYNKIADEPIKWQGQFIIRSEHTIFKDYWKLIKAAGGQRLAVGVETGSDAVRLHMNKKFTNADLDYSIKQMAIHGITCDFLMIVGYPTETEEDFQETLDMFTRYKDYAKTVIHDINIGSTLGVLPGTPLYNHAEELHIDLDKYENNWMALDNPELTLERRLSRRQELADHLTALGYYFNNGNDGLANLLKKNLEKFNLRRNLRKKFIMKQVA